MRDIETRLHESGHQAIGVLAFGWTAGAITVTPGGLSYGCSAMNPPPEPDWQDWMDHQPFILWPQEHQTHLQQGVLTLMAGDVAVCALLPLAEPQWAAEEAIAIVKEHPPDESDQEWAAAVVSDPGNKSDAEKIARRARFAHRDANHAAHVWLEWLHGTCLDLVERHETAIRELAAVLDEHPVLSAAAVAAVLAKHDPAVLAPC